MKFDNMALIRNYIWIFTIVFICNSKHNNAATPPDMDQETYCSICKISAEVFHTTAPRFTDITEWTSTNDAQLMDTWKNLCVYKNFKAYKTEHPVKTIVQGCKFLQESSDVFTTEDGEVSHDSMFEMTKQMVLHNEGVKSMQSAMCYTTSNACKALNKSISDLDGKEVDVSPEAIQKILDNPTIRKPSPIRMKPEL